MIIDSQLHGYRQGHELLSSTISLDRADQSVVDQLSDVAGPLRPSEVFDPYLSAYPLPSGSHFVLARTWQDLAVQRAGCVRTLSLFIPATVWEEASGLQEFLLILGPEKFPSDTSKYEVHDLLALPQPVPGEFQASELIEALFLEESKPVAIFDAPDVEVIAVRLLTALWPALRRRFTLSTFALSPRRYGERSFDLVFSPKDARSRFSDWPGRRVDGRANQPARHRWTQTIANRVFYEPIPRLLSETNSQFADLGDSGSASALRISLLWDELIIKLALSPTAVLGLLDIANSRNSSDGNSVKQLEAALGSAPQRAVRELPTQEGWAFINAMARKLQNSQFSAYLPKVAQAAGDLASRDPAGAIDLLDNGETAIAQSTLTSEIADGLSRNFEPSSVEALVLARPKSLLALIAANARLAALASQTERLVPVIRAALNGATPDQLKAARENLLPALTTDHQLPVAIPLFESLDEKDLLSEVCLLASDDTFHADSFYGPLIRRAKALGILNAMRDTLLTMPTSPTRDRFLAESLAGDKSDFAWLVATTAIDSQTLEGMLAQLLVSLSDAKFRTVFHDQILTDSVLSRLSNASTEAIIRILEGDVASPSLHIDATLKVLASRNVINQIQLVNRALKRGLSTKFDGDEVASLVRLLDLAGDQMDCRLLTKQGVSHNVPSSLVSRNLVAFQRSGAAARECITKAIDNFVLAYADRRVLVDLDRAGAEAFAHLIFDSQRSLSISQARAVGALLPQLLRSTHFPVSLLLASVFSIVYRELPTKNLDVPSAFDLFPFFEWDRRKTARRDLVRSYMSASDWPPLDFALTACLCDDVDKIVGQAMKAYGDSDFITQMLNDLDRLPPNCAKQIRRALNSYG